MKGKNEGRKGEREEHHRIDNAVGLHNALGRGVAGREAVPFVRNLAQSQSVELVGVEHVLDERCRAPVDCRRRFVLITQEREHGVFRLAV